MKGELIVVGGGAHARVVIVAAKQAGFNVIGYTDRHPSIPELSASYLGTDDVIGNHPNAQLVLGIGSVRADTLREAIVDRICVAAERWARVVEPSAFVAPDTSLGPGVVILAGSIVACGSVIGPHALVNSMVMVDHDCIVGGYTHLCPGSILGGGASIGPHSLMGINSCLRDHVALGANVTVGMGAVVTKPFGDGCVLAGNPAAPFQRVAADAPTPHGTAVVSRPGKREA
jgi:sugar O-acyltransferase (sialic acid O-acetyltransferase NeuD family)